MTRRLLILLALIAATSAAALASPVTAQAAKPCWVLLLNDWYDGRIDKAYPVSCYRAAIKNLPDDVASYSNAREEINRALLAAINKSKQEGDTLTGSDLVPADTGATTGSIGRTSTLPGETGEELEPGDDPGSEAGGPVGSGDDGGDDDGVLGVLKPANAESVPIPLLVLAGLALVLLAAASAGFVARRLQARRAGLPRGPEAP